MADTGGIIGLQMGSMWSHLCSEVSFVEFLGGAGIDDKILCVLSIFYVPVHQHVSVTQKAISKIIDQARRQVQDEPEKKDGKVVTRL